MKSKTVASIVRHVASKVPSVGVEGQEEVKTAEQEEKEHEAKRSRRAHRKEAQERGEEVIEDEGVTTSASEEERCEQLYDQIAWPLGKIYGHPYDAFKLALTCVYIWHALLFTVCHCVYRFKIVSRTPFLVNCNLPYLPQLSTS